MASALASGLTDVFRSQALGPFAVRSGESESSVLKGFEASIGTMLTGLSSKLRQTGFARQFLDLINSPGNDSHVLEHARNLVDEPPADGVGSRFTSMLFGGNLPAITDNISSASGLRRGTAASLMSLGAPMLLGSLVQRVRGMDPSGLTRFVSQEAAGVRDSVPGGISRLLGPEETVPPVTTAVVPQRRPWLWPLIAALAILGLIWWLASRRAAPVGTAFNCTGAAVTRTLAGNTNLQVPQGCMEDRLLAYVQDPSRRVDDTTWFEFDRTAFDSNSATLQPASTEQLRNVAAIMNAYPNVRARIGAYAGNSGNAAANQALSQQRADTVKQQLIGMGVGADRLEAQGLGSQFLVADNATRHSGQNNERIALHVTQK